jgi:hypothetical protein
MADSASESDTGSLDGGGFQPPSPVSREQLQKRIESLQQQNRVLSVELETYKLRVKSLQASSPSALPKSWIYKQRLGVSVMFVISCVHLQKVSLQYL